MKTVNECIADKDWKALAKITFKQINYKKNKEGLRKENELTIYQIENSMKIRELTDNFRYKRAVR